MASVRDASGNTPEADSDQSGQGHYNLQAVQFRGTQHSLTNGSSAVSTVALSRACRAVRIAPLGDTFWEMGPGAVATETSPPLPSNAIEIVPVVQPGTVVSVIQGIDNNTAEVVITEDRS